jgi:hypothetical protein
MHFHPDLIPPFIQFQRASTAGDPKVPMMATCTPSEFAFTSNDEAAPAALFEHLASGELEIEFQHCLQRS